VGFARIPNCAPILAPVLSSEVIYANAFAELATIRPSLTPSAAATVMCVIHLRSC
jgi:hypothetical protein